MVRTHGVSALALLLAVAGCARAPSPSVLLTPQTRFGLGDGYGSGIVSASARAMRYQLAISAHVIVLRVTQDSIEQVSPSPTGGRDRLEGPGSHWVRIAATRRLDAAGVDPSAFASDPGSLSCVPVLDPNLNAKPDPTCVERVRRESGPRPPAAPQHRVSVNELGYWLLIVSDARTPGDELKHRLAFVEVDDASPLLVIMEQLPGLLVGGRTTNWAAYYVGFAEVSPARH